LLRGQRYGFLCFLRPSFQPAVGLSTDFDRQVLLNMPMLVQGFKFTAKLDFFWSVNPSLRSIAAERPSSTNRFF